MITAGKDTVAVRVPNHPLTLALLNDLDFPLTAPSANPFGSISPTNAQHVINYFGAKIEAVLDGGQCENGLESTIVGFENEEPILYRHGAICIEEIEKVTGHLNYHTINDTSPSAPGMLTRHYAPKTETLCSNDVNLSINLFKGKKIGVLVFQKEIENDKITKQEILSKNGDFDEAAKNLYAAMHRLDEYKLDVLIIEKLPDLGLGKTINDKLVRAAKK